MTAPRALDLAPAQSPTVSRPPLWSPQLGWALLMFVATLWALLLSGVGRQELVNPAGLALVGRFFGAALHPELESSFLRLTASSTLTTLAYAVCGTSLSLVIGMVGGVLASEVWGRDAGGRGDLGLWLARTSLALPRAIHEVIWGLFFINVLGLDPLVAVLAIAIPFGAITAKVFAEILDETPRHAFTALLNSGTPRLTAMLYGLLSTAFPNLLAYSFYRFECAIRSAAVLGLIGAGGLGYQILLSLQSLRYEQMWTLFGALFLLNGLTDVWSSMLRRRLNLASRLELNLHQGPRQTRLGSGDGLVRGSVVAVVALLAFSWWYIQADPVRLLAPRALSLLQELSARAWPPAWELLSLAGWVSLAAQTLALSVLAIVLAGLGGILLSYPAASNLLLPGGTLARPTSFRVGGLVGLVLYLATRATLLVCRSIPAPVWALLLLFVLFPGILPGALALALYNLGILGRLMAEGVENLDPRPARALMAQGAPGSLLFLYSVLPRTLPSFVAYILYRWEVCMRETVLLGLVGAAGLGRLLAEQLSSFDYPSVTAILLVYMAVTVLVDTLSGAMRRSLRG